MGAASALPPLPAPTTAPAAVAVPAAADGSSSQPHVPLQLSVAVGVPVGAAPQQQLHPQPQLPLQHSLNDPLQALISRAENLRQAMSRAALEPSPLLFSNPLSSGASLSVLPPPTASASTAGVLPGVLSGPIGLPAAASGAPGSSTAHGLSATTAALIDAARTLSRTHQQGAAAAAAPPPPLGGSIGSPVNEGLGLPAIGSTAGAPAATVAAVGVTAAAPIAELSWEDPAELAEDIILQELFFSRPAQPTAPLALSCGHVSLPEQQQQGPGRAGAAGEAGGQGAQQQQPAGPVLVLSLQLGALQLLEPQPPGAVPSSSAAEACAGSEGPRLLTSRALRVRGVVKPLHPSAKPLQFALTTSSSSGGGGSGSAAGGAAAWPDRPNAGSVQLEVPVPQACVEQGRLPATLFVEVSLLGAAMSSLAFPLPPLNQQLVLSTSPGLRFLPASYAQVWGPSDALVGVVRVPLSFCPLPPAPGAGGEGGAAGDCGLPAVVCEGRWDVWNVLEGRAAGSVELFAVVQVTPHGDAHARTAMQLKKQNLLHAVPFAAELHISLGQLLLLLLLTGEGPAAHGAGSAAQLLRDHTGALRKCKLSVPRMHESHACKFIRQHGSLPSS